MEKHIQLAQALPPQLLQLFRRFPPKQISGMALTVTPPQLASTSRITTTETTPPSDPNATNSTITTLLAPEKRKKNPFLPFKNPRTGNWHGAHYSLRRQADLFKLAIKHNVLPLMPRSPKHPEVKEARRLELGVRVKGTGPGQKVKGHKWERMLQHKLEVRRQAMEAMPALIKEWKESGFGRRWRKYPK